MSFTDLSNIADQVKPPPQRQQQQDQQPQDDPAQQPPDPRTIQPPGQTNPVSALQSAPAVPAPQIPTGLRNDASAEQKTDQDIAFPAPTFAPAIYRPPAADRGPDGWGQPYAPIEMAQQYPGPAPGPDMPSVHESYGEIGTVGQQIQQWGSPAEAEAAGQASFLSNPISALLDGISQGRFSRNFTAANLRALQIRQREMVMATQRTWQIGQQQLQSYGSIFKETELGAISPQQGEQRVRDYALQIGDQKLLEVLNTRGMRGAAQYLNWRDAAMRRMWSAGTQVGKVAGANRDQQEFEALGGRSTATTPGGDPGALGVDPNRLPGRGGPTMPAAPAPPTEEPLNPYEEKIAAGLRDANGNPVTPQMAAGIMRAARAKMIGDPQEIPIDKDSPAATAIGQVQAALGANIDRIAKLKPSPNEDPDEFAQKQLEAIKQNNPGIAQQVDDLKNLRIDPQAFTVAGGQRRRVVDLTSQIYPHWNQGMYHAFQNVWNNGNSQETRQIEAGNRGTTQAVILEAAINRIKIPEDSTIPANVWNEWKTQGYTSDPQFAALNEPLRAFAGEMVFLQTGRVNVTPVTQFLKEAPLYGGKAQLRTMLRQAMIGGLHTMEQKTGVFNRQTGMSGLPPSTDPDAMAIYDEFARSNPNTGMFAKDAPAELKSIEPSAEDRARRPSWRTKDQEFEPMGKGEWQRLRATIEDLRQKNPNDPRLPQLMHEFGIRQ